MLKKSELTDEAARRARVRESLYIILAHLRASARLMLRLIDKLMLR